MRELQLQGITAKRQLNVPVEYKGHTFDLGDHFNLEARYPDEKFSFTKDAQKNLPLIILPG
jgi:hypothetical protein